jgi:ATP-dependent DNA helicase RecQ
MLFCLASNELGLNSGGGKTGMAFDGNRALELLRAGTTLPDATFREGQDEAIRFVVEGRGRLLVIQKTGWGKSFVYFIATKLLRESGTGPALLVSPLLALMRNQIDAAERMGVRAATINSDNKEDWDSIESAMLRDEVDILLVSPERLANERFRNELLARLAHRIALFVVDEAHCISDWGHDFRPSYRQIERTIRAMPRNLRILATTATANDRVTNDLLDVLGPRLEVLRGDLSRPSLMLQSIRLPSQAERLAWLAQIIPNLPGSGIVYTLTVRDAEQVADWLKSCGLNVESYTGRTGEFRPQLEQALLDNRVKALVATTALGMGFDKPDLAFVIHYQSQGSAVAYYQQVGRAGRRLDSAYGILLSGEEETDITDYFIETAFPSREEVQDLLSALESHPDGLSVPELMTHVNVSYSRIQKTIELLSLESPSPIVKMGTKWQLTVAELSEEFWSRSQRLTELRRVEQRQMQDYTNLTSGHMEFLVQALDGDPAGVTSPDLAPLPASVDPQLLNRAIAFLRRMSLPIEPRKRWPAGGLPYYGVNGAIPRTHQAEEGRALCVWGDAGWGGLVRRGKYQDGRFSDELIEACVGMVHNWNPQPSPEWVTCIPSLRHPGLVSDFARRLAERLGLPFEDVLVRTEMRPEQKTMENSSQQARNVDGSMAVGAATLCSGPVLLVDDMVDSGWTMTVGAWLLREHGSGEVWPLALALTR